MHGLVRRSNPAKGSGPCAFALRLPAAPSPFASVKAYNFHRRRRHNSGTARFKSSVVTDSQTSHTKGDAEQINQTQLSHTLPGSTFLFFRACWTLQRRASRRQGSRPWRQGMAAEHGPKDASVACVPGMRVDRLITGAFVSGGDA